MSVPFTTGVLVCVKLTLLRSGCAKILRIGIGIERIVNRYWKKWWCCWRECEEGEEACWLFVYLWIERRYIEEWDVEKCYEGYFEVKYIIHWHLECASARHPVALETYICYWSIARLLWYVRPTVSARDSGVQEMCSSSGEPFAGILSALLQ